MVVDLNVELEEGQIKATPCPSATGSLLHSTPRRLGDFRPPW